MYQERSNGKYLADIKLYNLAQQFGKFVLERKLLLFFIKELCIALLIVVQIEVQIHVNSPITHPFLPLITRVISVLHGCDLLLRHTLVVLLCLVFVVEHDQDD